MPELPEVEITRRGLAAHLTGLTIADAVIRNGSLRWPIPKEPAEAAARTNHSLAQAPRQIPADGLRQRHADPASGHVRQPAHPACEHSADKHDHFDLILEQRHADAPARPAPLRRGAVAWRRCAHPPAARRSRPRTLPIKPEIKISMRAISFRPRASAKPASSNASWTAASWSAWATSTPTRPCSAPASSRNSPQGKLSLPRCEQLVAAIRATLNEAIKQGGSSLRDFVDTSGKPGYFQQNYWVYGRAGEPCRRCGLPITQIRQGQRSSFYCRNCQK